MGTVQEKLEYTLRSVNDIQNAIIEKGVIVAPTVELAEYGNKIREIKSGGTTVVNFDSMDIIKVLEIPVKVATVTNVTSSYS